MYVKRANFDWVRANPGTYKFTLQPGTYKITLRGGGGGGANNGRSFDRCTGGKGGCGGPGFLAGQTHTLNFGAQVEVIVGAAGLSSNSGGNGGRGGTNGGRYGPGADGGQSDGSGGGGGWPSVVKIATRQNAYYWGNGLYTISPGGGDVFDSNGARLVNWNAELTEGKMTFTRNDGYVYEPTGYVISSLPLNLVLSANGGGGGGGGGNGAGIGRYSGGGGGGGGGGWYYYNRAADKIVSVPGKPGRAGGGGGSGPNTNMNGYPGNADFSSIRSGGGGGPRSNSAGAAGGGASGGGGDYGEGNESWAWGGPGGGGAGGAPDAGGGTCAYRDANNTAGATNATNPRTVPVSVPDPWGNTVTSGYGIGGVPGGNGAPGWVRIQEQ